MIADMFGYVNNSLCRCYHLCVLVQVSCQEELRKAMQERLELLEVSVRQKKIIAEAEGLKKAYEQHEMQLHDAVRSVPRGK